MVRLTAVEIEMVDRILHDYAAKMMFALEADKITTQQFEAYEILYDRLMFFLEDRELH